MDRPLLRRRRLVRTRFRSLVQPDRTISGPTLIRLCSRAAVHLRPLAGPRSSSHPPTPPRSSLPRSHPWHHPHLEQEMETSLHRPDRQLSSAPTRPTITTFATCRSMCLARTTMRRMLRFHQDRNRIVAKCFISSLRYIPWTTL